MNEQRAEEEEEKRLHQKFLANEEARVKKMSPDRQNEERRYNEMNLHFKNSSLFCKKQLCPGLMKALKNEVGFEI